MKPNMKRSDLTNNDDIWNAVINVLSEDEVPNENKVFHEAFLVFQYYAELESGGHESLFHWFSTYIEEAGIANYLQDLTSTLEKIGAYEYANIEKTYGREIWEKFVALENNEIDEEEFYHIIGQADGEYYKLDSQLGELLEAYFIAIHTDLIEVIED